MGTTISPSDFTEINPSYSNGRGFYTNATEVANLLQIPAFSSSTYPTLAQIGTIIKRIEGIVDDKVKRSFRPIITKDEYHNFEFTRGPSASNYGGYVGFIQLKQMKVRKMISLLLWQGSQYQEVASAQAKVTLKDNFRDLNSIILQLPNSGVSFEMVAENVVGSLGNDEFCNTFGIKTTAEEIVNVVNEQFPSTSQYTGASAPKALTSSSLSISDFFYGSRDKSNGKQINISSLLLSDDGSDCVLKATIKQTCTTVNASINLTVADSSKLAVGMTVTGTGISGTITIASITNSTIVVLSGAATANGTNALTFTTTDSIPTVCDLTSFTDKEDMQRLGSYWTINEEGRVFFLRDYPYHKDNSVIATYVAGDNRVPSAIHEATTKLVAAEIIRMDDQSVLLAETGGNMSAKEKYDILRKEAMDTLKGKGDIVYFLD
jgi:hypothetical protein|tara:strand:+ start:385 stop:1686 length:1302 start_codon:yes stop_codon:yes gene_type:complete